jgi:hypothetical protein
VGFDSQAFVLAAANAHTLAQLQKRQRVLDKMILRDISTSRLRATALQPTAKATPHSAENKRRNEQHKCDYENDFGKTNRRSGDPAEPKQAAISPMTRRVITRWNMSGSRAIVPVE